MNSTSPLVDRAAWLEGRSRRVGASEAAAAVGVSPWSTPVELWQEKTGRITRGDDEGSEAMRWGTLLEPVILAEYERRTGAAVVGRQRVVTHPVLPFLAATLDGVTEGGKLVEVKTASGFSRGFGGEGGDEFPDHYRVQVHAQMACTGATEADLVVLLGGQTLRVYPVARDDGLVNAVEDRVAAFWKCVETDTPPDWGRTTPADLAVLFPGCAGEVEDAAALATIAGLVEQHERLKARASDAAEVAEALKAQVLKLMGNAALARLPDGRVVRRHRRETPARQQVVNYKAAVTHYFTVGSKGGGR